MQPAEPVQAAHRYDAHVLQIALRPAPVARRVVDDVGGYLLPAAGDLGHQPDLVTGAAHERRLDDVVAEDFAAEGWGARQARQRAVLRERAQPDDRIVAPVIALAQLPERKAAGQHRAV